MFKLRLSNGRDRAVEFTNAAAATLRRDVMAAWRAYRVQLATLPDYFAIITRHNNYLAHLSAQRAPAEKARRVAAWCAGGHSPERAERLWRDFEHDLTVRTNNALNQVSNDLLPVRLQLHVQSNRRGDWLAPWNDVFAATVAEDGTVTRHAPERGIRYQAATWNELYCGIERICQHDSNIRTLCQVVAQEAVAAVTPPPPHLTLVPQS